VVALPVADAVTADRPTVITEPMPGNDDPTTIQDTATTDDADHNQEDDMPTRPDEGIADLIEAADPREMIDFETDVGGDFTDDVCTPGAELSSAERDLAFHTMITEILERGRGTEVEVTSAELADRWLSIPGMTLSQRPALQRRITRLVEIGAWVRKSHGVYTLAPEALDIMRSAVPDAGPEDDEDADD
jgi:hypothetical protein